MFSGYVPVTELSIAATVAAAEVDFSTTMVAGRLYVYVCDIASWIKQGTTPAASAADGSMYVPANTPIPVLGNNGTKLSTIRHGGADGKASLTPMQQAR